MFVVKSGRFSLVLLLASVTVACGGSDSSGNDSESSIGNYRLATGTSNFDDGSSQTSTSAYNDIGYLIGQTFQTSGAATPSLEVQYSYDAVGQLDTIVRDEGANGTVDRQSKYFYTSGGQLLRRDTDVGNDGNVDLVRNYTVDSENRLLEFTSSEQNDDGSSTVVSRTIFGYQSGRVDTMEFDFAPLGDIDSVSQYQYNSDGSLNTITTTSQDAADSRQTTYTYEAGVCDRASMVAGFSYFCVTL